MAAIRDRTKPRSYEYFEEDEPLSMAQQHLQELLRKQLSTKKVSVKGTIEQGKEFAPAVVYEPLAAAVEGLHSLKEYQAKEGEHGYLDNLRELGLTDQEIELKLSLEREGEEATEPAAKKKKLSVEPAAQEERMRALQQKISSREELLARPVTFKGVHHMSRHAMEVENSLYRHQGNPLTHLTVEDTHSHVNYPSSVIPVSKERTSSRSGDGSSEGHEEITPLPIQVIERNRLTETELAALPRFKGHDPGEPSEVLYLKNLHSSVTAADLEAVFGALKPPDVLADSWKAPQIKLMRGRLRGQAFVTFPSVEGAMKGMKTINGFVMKEKPVIISFGRSKQANLLK